MGEIYKYLPPQRIDVLQNLTIRYTQPAAFNDPFESFPAVEVPADVKFYKEQFRQLVADEISRRPFLNTIVKRKQYERARRKDFRKFHESESNPKHHEGLGLRLQNSVSSVNGVLSLTELRDNILMWGHYADSHHGFVIGFDWDHPYFKGLIHHIIYSPDRPVMRPLQDNPGEQLRTKSEHWAYEKEWRKYKYLIEPIPLPDGTKFVPFSEDGQTVPKEGWPIKLFPFPPESIASVSLGWRMGSEVKVSILKALRSHNLTKVQIYESKPHDKEYRMVFDLLGCVDDVEI